MGDGRHRLPSDIRGYGRLAVDATRGVTRVVEAMHGSISPVSRLLGRDGDTRTHGITRLVYRTIYGTTSMIGEGIDAALAMVPAGGGVASDGRPEGIDSASTGKRDATLAVVNGLVGDHLARTFNPLAIAMCLRHDGRPLDADGESLARSIPRPRRRLLVLVHGLCLSDACWRTRSHDRGATLAASLGATAIHLRYNTGLHVSVNGRAFASKLEELVARWPVAIDAISIVCHSMGGLVARSAVHHASAAGHAWPARLRRLAFLGTPHHGAPLERAGNYLQAVLGASRYTAALGTLGTIRSAGITDLRHGSVTDEDWRGRDRFAHHADTRRPVPLPAGVACYAVAGTRHRGSPGSGGGLAGDGLVPLDSALGRHGDPRLSLDFPPAHCFVASGAGHLALLGRPDVYVKLHGWFGS